MDELLLGAGVTQWERPQGAPAAGGPFVPSAAFTGAVPGYVFKMGAKGLGYYMDGVQQPGMRCLLKHCDSGRRCRQEAYLMMVSARTNLANNASLLFDWFVGLVTYSEACLQALPRPHQP